MTHHPLILLNGQLLNATSPCIPVQDRGLRYGDAVFETLMIENGAAPLWHRHATRLENACAALGFPAPNRTELADWLQQLCAVNNAEHGAARITITRGDGTLENGGAGYAPPREAAPRIIIQTTHRPTNSPTHAWLVSMRKPDPRHFPSNHKTANALVSVLAMHEAQAHDCTEALLLAADGSVCSASSGCVFWQDAHGDWHTPPLSSGALNGIARSLLLEHGGAHTTITSLALLETARAVASVNSVRGVSPILSLEPHGWQWDSTLATQRLDERLRQAIATETTPTTP